jgi:tetratricopeptide (TPR) repeat protein
MNTNLPSEMRSLAVRAMQAMQQGNYTAAVACFDKLGNFAHEDEYLAKAAGFAHLHLGNEDRALLYLAASLKGREAQADVHAALGDIFVQRSDQDNSLKHLRRAIELAPGAPELRLKQGLALIGFERYKEAAVEMRAALAMRPQYLQARLGLARALINLDKLSEAEAELQNARTLAPQNYAVAFRTGKLREKQQRFDDAIALYKEVEVSSNHAAPVCEALALAELSYGNTEAALATFRRGLQANPLHRKLLMHAAELRYEMGDPDAFSYYEQALKTRPVPAIRSDYIAYLIIAQRVEDARLQLRQYEADNGRDPTWFALTAQLLYELGNYQEALKTLALAPAGDQELMSWKAKSLLSSGDTLAAQNLLLELLKKAPYDQYLLALLSTCYRLSDNDAYHELVDYDRLLIRSELDVPPGFGNLASFNEALRETVEELHVMRSQPLSQSVIGGTQTPGNLLNQPHPVIRALKQAFHTTLTRELGPSFYQSISDTHPVSRGRGHDITLPAAWSIWVTEGGYHRPHVHSKGWYSSAYYVSLPATLKTADRPEDDGKLAFGRPEMVTPVKLGMERMITPAEGILALFPSYFWHETLPFKSSEARVVVAFDALPAV